MLARSADRTPADITNTLSTAAPATVYGSLDPPNRSKKTAKSGWRYIQLTDSLDELRVLLPPRPAAIYANLLKVEAHAIARNDAESLRDLQYIRYLKDAMIRRCQQLARETVRATQSSRPISVVQAPLDFKVKRLEKWWEMMEPQVKTKGHSNHVKNQVNAEQSSRATTSPSQSRINGTTVAQAHTAHGITVAHQQYAADSQAYPSARKGRPTPLTVPAAGHTLPAQPSPLVPHTPQSPGVSISHASAQLTNPQSPHMTPPYDYSARPDLRQAASHIPVYANSQTASPLGTPYNPSFDPNQSLATQQYQTTYMGNRGPVLVEASSPAVAVGSGIPPLAADPRVTGQHVYSSTDVSSQLSGFQADPSHLKSRFHATYTPSSTDSMTSPSSGGSNPPTYAQRNLRSQAGPGHTPYIRANASLSTPVPSTAGTSAYEKDHRRTATVDCDDTDRSIPRPKGYMYRAGAMYGQTYDIFPEAQYDGHSYDAQGGRCPEGDHSPSTVQRMARILNQSLVLGGSPRSSAGSQGSPRLHSSPAAPYTMESSPHSQNSPGQRHYQNQGYGATLSVEHAYGRSGGNVKNGSPNLLPPDPALSRSRRGSNESDISASKTASGTQGVNGTLHTTRQLRRTVSRRGLHDPNPVSNSQPVVPPPEYYSTQSRSPRSSTITPSDVQQLPEAGVYHRGRARRGERSPRRGHAYDASPRRGHAVIPDMAVLSSNRNSRYTSGDSSVSEPVIPDVSLIMEAELSRSKGDRVRRRLVPFQSSSSEGGSQHPPDFELDYSSSDGEDDAQDSGYYRRPYRPRDGYGSGYASEAGGANSRAPSRAPSRSPSRGILKRSSSVCSQRSNKSVRLEIPRDRRALEEVRDAEDKVDRAQKRLDDLQRQKGNRSKTSDPDIQKATETLDEAKRGLKDKEDEYQAILEALKLKRSQQQDQTQPRYV